MKAVLRSVVVMCALARLVQGCTDPGCIRNSECETGFSCLAQVCTRASGDGGTAGGASPSQPNREDASMSVPDEPDEPDEPDLPDEDAGF